MKNAEIIRNPWGLAWQRLGRQLLLDLQRCQQRSEAIEADLIYATRRPKAAFKLKNRMGGRFSALSRLKIDGDRTADLKVDLVNDLDI